MNLTLSGGFGKVSGGVRQAVMQPAVFQKGNYRKIKGNGRSFLKEGKQNGKSIWDWEQRKQNSKSNP